MRGICGECGRAVGMWRGCAGVFGVGGWSKRRATSVERGILWQECGASWQKSRAAGQERGFSWQKRRVLWQENGGAWQERSFSWQKLGALWQKPGALWQKRGASWTKSRALWTKLRALWMKRSVRWLNFPRVWRNRGLLSRCGYRSSIFESGPWLSGAGDSAFGGSGMSSFPLLVACSHSRHIFQSPARVYGSSHSGQ